MLLLQEATGHTRESATTSSSSGEPPPLVTGWEVRFGITCERLDAWVTQHNGALPSVALSKDSAESSLGRFLHEARVRYCHGMLSDRLTARLLQIPGLEARAAQWGAQLAEWCR